MVDADNFVGRLRVLAGKLAKVSKDLPAQQVLAGALGVSPTSIEFHRRLVLLVELADRALEQASELAEDPSQDLYVGIIEEIVKTLQQLDMRGNWNTHLPAFNQRTLALLETCERAVDRQITIEPPTKETLAQVLAAIQEAIDSVLQADMEAEARLILLEMLREVERALLTYEISGLAGLRRAVERTLGAAFLHKGILGQSRAPGIVKKTFKALSGALSLLKNLDFITQLPEKARDVFNLLPG